MQKILIFDLDDTLSKDCYKQEKTSMIVNLLKNANRNKWKIYVVTSRGINSKYVGKLSLKSENILSYSINPNFVSEIKENQHKYFSHGERQVYYIDREFFQKKDSLNIDSSWKKQNWTSVIKMLQIEDIKEKNRNIPWNNFYFFDDAKYHLSAWRYWSSLINPAMNEMKFFGGQGHCVFSDYDYNDLSRCGLITKNVRNPFKEENMCNPQRKFTTSFYPLRTDKDYQDFGGKFQY